MNSNYVNESVVSRMRQQMSVHEASPEHDSDGTNSSNSPEEREEMEQLAGFIELLETVTPAQLKLKAMSRTVTEQMHEVVSGPRYGAMTHTVASHFTWDGKKFKVLSTDILQSLAAELRSVFSGEECPEDLISDKSEEQDTAGVTGLDGLAGAMESAGLEAVAASLGALRHGSGEIAEMGNQLKLVEQQVSQIKELAARTAAEAENFEEEEEEEVEEVPQKQTRFTMDHDIEGSGRPKAKQVAAKSVLKPSVVADCERLDQVIKGIEAEQGAAKIKPRMASLMAQLAEGDASHLQAVRRDLLSSAAEVAKVPLGGGGGGGGGGVPTQPDPLLEGYGVFGDNKILKRGPTSANADGWKAKIRANFKQYAFIFLVVMIMNMRGFTKMIELISED